MLSFLTLNEDDELFDVLTDVVDGATLVSGRVGQVRTENEKTVSVDKVVEVRLCNDVIYNSHDVTVESVHVHV